MNSDTGALHLWAYDGKLRLTMLFVDRKRDRATIFGTGLCLPMFRVLAPLALITGLQVFKSEHDEGKPKYGIQFRVRCGDSVKFHCRSRDQAMAISHAIAQYLGLDHRSEVSPSAQPHCQP